MTTLLSLAVAVIAGLMMTRVVKRFSLPAVTAYLVAGVLIGPYCLGRLRIPGIGFESMEQLDGLKMFSEVALGFIAFAIGNEFRLSSLRETGRQATIVGIVQALTEYLPVSSSAHIRIFGDLMLGSDPGAAFTAIIQIGTELAVILYFRHDIINILTHWFSCLFGKNGKDWKARMGRGDNYATLGWNIIVGSIPIIILGFTLQNVIETSLRNLWITVTVLLVFGILLWMVDAKARQNKTMNDMTYRDAFLFGLGQSMALIPGVSRSGGTITVGRALGYTREAAVRLSFLMAIPAVFGSGLLEAIKAVKNYKTDAMFPGWGPTLVAMVISFVLGYIVIIGFLKFVSNFSYKAFAIYRIGLAVVVALLLIVGVLPAIDPSVVAAA